MRRPLALRARGRGLEQLGCGSGGRHPRGGGALSFLSFLSTGGRLALGARRARRTTTYGPGAASVEDFIAAEGISALFRMPRRPRPRVAGAATPPREDPFHGNGDRARFTPDHPRHADRAPRSTVEIVDAVLARIEAGPAAQCSSDRRRGRRAGRGGAGLAEAAVTRGASARVDGCRCRSRTSSPSRPALHLPSKSLCGTASSTSTASCPSG